MKRLLRGKRRQRGAALILFITVLVLGVAWFAVGALGKAAVATSEREVKTGVALQAAKQALLAYVAQYAARIDHDKPGRLPCPESLNSIGTANEGQAPGSCSNVTVEIGRLPWQTLGIDKPLDGDGEALWYVLSPGFRGVTPTSAINFATPGQLMYNGAANAAVAVIIAPGRALNTAADPDSPPAGCAKVNQQVAARNTAPLAVANFLECGNAAASYLNPGTSKWTNDRAISITAAEWADAIAGGVADRLQRQVAPALNDWRAQATAAWGVSFLPYASTFGNPSGNDFCGDASTSTREGLLPVANASAACASWWESGTATQVLGLGTLLFGSPFCFQTGASWQCWIFYDGLLGLRVTATLSNVAGAFRAPITVGDIVATDNLGAPAPKSNFSLSIAPATGAATVSVDVNPPLAVGFGWVTVTIPNLQDHAFLSDARLTWFLQNNWQQHTYYAAAPSATINPTACAAAGDPGCLEVRGLPASSEPASGAYWQKRFALLLMGSAVSGQDRAGAPNSVGSYLEEQNASTGDNVFRADLRVANPSAATTPYPAFNDRLATCPLRYAIADGTFNNLCL